MKTPLETSGNNTFLSGGGEAGELTRAFDWQSTSIGPVEQWPQALRSTLGILLHSAFPMFLFWGEDLVCFYNDAFRPSLGINGKHPAIGQKGKDVWKEIWNLQGPMIESVMATGEPVYHEDSLVPYYRNGKIEDIYWTFSYSPAYGDDGKVNGVFVTCMETTDKVQTLKALSESEQRFRVMAESTAILIAISDETSNATYFNKAWTDFTGRSAEELLNFGWADLIHEEDRQQFLDIYLHAFEKRENWTGEFRILAKNGEYRWLLANGPAIFANDGSFTGYISSSTDITASKEAEAKAQESTQQIRSLVESAPFPIGVYVGEEMRIVLANQSILDVWGKGNDVIGKLYTEILPELENQPIFEQIRSVLHTGNPFHARNQRVDLFVNGELRNFYFNYSFTPLYDAAGKIYGVMNTAAEITDLNLAKLKVEQSEKNFRSMILQAPVAMCIMTGPDHVVEVANDFMIHLWGKQPEDVLNRPMFEGLPDAREQGLEELLSNVYKTGVSFKADERAVVLLRNGKQETVYQNFVYDPYVDAEGTIVGVLAISIDVTAQVLARRKIEEIVTERTKELAAANDNLQRSNAELAQFAYIASHDLQEPLRKISTFTQMLESRVEGQIDDKAQNYLEKIRNSSGRMHTLIRDVLSYSELVKESEELTAVDLNHVVESTLTDYELLIEQKGATINVEQLPVIEAIPLQMSQLFGNLIGNSLKFTRESVKPVISISVIPVTPAEKEQAGLDPKLDFVQLQLRDNGIGFKKEHAEQIFNIFQRLHRKSDYAGTGIGLAMCKKIALNHHGDLNAAGSSEEGAVFNALLPVRQG